MFDNQKFDYFGITQMDMSSCIRTESRCRIPSSSLPQTTDEIADSVFEVYTAGAKMFHLHPRESKRLYKGARHTETWYEIEAVQK